MDISTTLIHDHTAKTEPVVTDALLLADSQASNVNKKATITNIAKATGERFAGTNATSALSEADGVGRVNIGSTTASTAPAPADKLLIEVGGVNKSTTITNLTKAVGEVAAGTQASSALTEVDGVMAVDPTDVAVAVGADSVLIRDATDGFVHEDAIADLMTAAAGTGLSATGGVLAVELNEVGSEVIDPNKDSIVFIDEETVGDPTKKELVSDFVGLIVGTETSTGLSAASGVISASLGYTAAAVDVTADEMVIIDATDGAPKTEAVADVIGAAAGTASSSGLSATSGVLKVAPADSAMVVSADSIMYVNAAGTPKKDLISDFVGFMAGDGLAASAGVLSVQDPGAMAVGSVRFAATGDCTGVDVGAVSYDYDATPVVTDGEWAYGASASESATNLAAAINGKTGSPYGAIANTDTVHIYARAVGTAGNVTVARDGGTQPAAVENLVGGRNAGNRQWTVRSHTVTANDVETAVLVNIPLPFTPTAFMAWVTDSTGLPLACDDLFTIEATPDRIQVADGSGAAPLVATDVVTVLAFE